MKHVERVIAAIVLGGALAGCKQEARYAEMYSTRYSPIPTASAEVIEKGGVIITGTIDSITEQSLVMTDYHGDKITVNRAGIDMYVWEHLKQPESLAQPLTVVCGGDYHLGVVNPDLLIHAHIATIPPSGRFVSKHRDGRRVLEGPVTKVEDDGFYMDTTVKKGLHVSRAGLRNQYWNKFKSGLSQGGIATVIANWDYNNDGQVANAEMIQSGGLAFLMPKGTFWKRGQVDTRDYYQRK